jgi:hypothetical protein
MTDHWLPLHHRPAHFDRPAWRRYACSYPMLCGMPARSGARAFSACFEEHRRIIVVCRVGQPVRWNEQDATGDRDERRYWKFIGYRYWQSQGNGLRCDRRDYWRHRGCCPSGALAALVGRKSRRQQLHRADERKLEHCKQCGTHDGDAGCGAVRHNDDLAGHDNRLGTVMR